jgi:hypothetical protein
MPDAAAPARVRRPKNGVIAATLALNVHASMSVWLPESTWLTSPGFGQVSSSASIAAAAVAAT